MNSKKVLNNSIENKKICSFTLKTKSIKMLSELYKYSKKSRSSLLDTVIEELYIDHILLLSKKEIILDDDNSFDDFINYLKNFNTIEIKNILYSLQEKNNLFTLSNLDDELKNIMSKLLFIEIEDFDNFDNFDSYTKVNGINTDCYNNFNKLISFSKKYINLSNV